MATISTHMQALVKECQRVSNVTSCHQDMLISKKKGNKEGGKERRKERLIIAMGGHASR